MGHRFLETLRSVLPVLQMLDLRQRLLDIGGIPGGEPPHKFATRVCTEIDEWKKVAAAAGIKAQ